MISIDDEKLIVKGSQPELLSELTKIMRSMINAKVADASDIEYCILLASASTDELKKMASEKLDSLKKVSEAVDHLANMNQEEFRKNFAEFMKGKDWDKSAATLARDFVMEYMKKNG